MKCVSFLTPPLIFVGGGHGLFLLRVEARAFPEPTLASNEGAPHGREGRWPRDLLGRPAWSAHQKWWPTNLPFVQEAATWTLMSILHEWVCPKSI